MDAPFFEIDSRAFLAAIFLIVFLWGIYFFGRQYEKPSIRYSHPFASNQISWKERLADLPTYLYLFSLFLFITAFLDPHILDPKIKKSHAAESTLPTEGIAIYLLLDQSGSMGETITTRGAEGREKITKLDFMKEVTKDFILGNPSLHLPGRPNDMIGLISFARVPQILAPLTLDHEAIAQEISKIKVVNAYEDEGTSMGYAIFKAVNLIDATRRFAEEIKGKEKPAYEIKNSIIIVVTDGFQDPNPLDKGKRLRNITIEEAADFAKEKKIEIFMINVDPSFGSPEFAPHRRLLEKSTEETGGGFFLATGDKNLWNIYEEIDKIEKSYLPPLESQGASDKRPDLYRRISFYPYLIGAGMLFILVAMVLNTTFLKKIP